jgi:hypothetical protein
VCLIFCMIIPTASPAQAIQPAPPTPIDMKKVELGGTPWNSQWDQIIEKAPPPRNAFFAGPPRRASILPAILRDGHNRQTHILGLLLPGACGC